MAPGSPGFSPSRWAQWCPVHAADAVPVGGTHGPWKSPVKVDFQVHKIYVTVGSLFEIYRDQVNVEYLYLSTVRSAGRSSFLIDSGEWHLLQRLGLGCPGELESEKEFEEGIGYSTAECIQDPGVGNCALGAERVEVNRGQSSGWSATQMREGASFRFSKLEK
jgi:hypothetical protein